MSTTRAQGALACLLCALIAAAAPGGAHAAATERGEGAGEDNEAAVVRAEGEHDARSSDDEASSDPEDDTGAPHPEDRHGDAEIESDTDRFIEDLTYEQQAGLPPAASKIFFSGRSWAISGFGEIAYVGYLGEKNRQMEDIELYYSNLYRFVVYGAWRPLDWLVLYAGWCPDYGAGPAFRLGCRV